MALNIAANYTHIPASQIDSTILDGSSCKVFGISIGGTSNGRVLIEEFGTTTVILELDANFFARRTVVLSVPFVASRGLQVTTPANITCSVFHSNAT